MRRAPIVAAAVLAVFSQWLAPSARAAVDLTGGWTIVTQSIAGPMTTTFTLVQNGTQLDLTYGSGNGPHTGTIDPDAGTFTIPLPDTVTYVFGTPITCSGNGIAGTASPDGETMSGVHHAVFFHIRGCFDGGGPFTGVRVGCGNGFREGAETCDDGNAIDGDCCSADCTTAAADATPCDDGDACTPVDQCDAGRCDGGTPMVCDPCETCAGLSGCIVAEDGGCAPVLAGGKSKIFLRHEAGAPEKDRLVWSWKNGAPMAVADFGDPRIEDTYHLCVIDRTGGVPTVRMRRVAPMSSCGDKPCWKTRTNGFSFTSKSGSPDGLTGMTLVAGDVGRGKLSVKGKGAQLGVPPGGFTSPVTVRLERRYSAGCWQATFSTPQANDGTTFRAKSD
jgi:cysteine-rich repeat protein